MLIRSYRAELSKLVKGKGIYIALAVMLVLLILLGLFANLIDGIMAMPGTGGMDIMEMIRNVPREKYQETIAGLEAQLDQLENDNNTVWSRFVDEKGRYKSIIAVFKFLDAHEEIDVGDIEIPANAMFGIASNSYSFMMLALSVIVEVAVFYAVITMSGLLAGEYRDGTLKMQIMRPNTRNSIFTAKWLATFTVSAGILLVGTIIASIYAGFKFRFDSKDILCIINNADVFLMNENWFVILDLVFEMLALFAMIQFSAFMCSISKFNRGASMAVPIIILLFGNISAYLLQVVYLGVLDFTNNLKLINFLIPTGTNLPYTSLYTALPILLVYIALFMSVSYIKFNREEL